MLGQTLDHYRVLEKLGEGGMGVVYLAVDTRLNRQVALKVLPADAFANPKRKERFIQEVQAASAMNHPNIITVYDIGSTGGIDYMVMEYVAGKTLDQLIPSKGLRLSEALGYAVQIVDTLSRAHAAGMVLRDLKPANIVVTPDGLVKLLDFGLARLTEPIENDEPAPAETLKPQIEEGAILGTVAYMSPEQAEGKAVDARSDIFAFGAILYEIVTGRRAFQGDCKLSTRMAILQEDPPRLEGVPADLEKIITRCLRKDPIHRFQRVDDVKTLLEDFKEACEPGRKVVSPSPRPRNSTLSEHSRRDQPVRFSGILRGLGAIALLYLALGVGGIILTLSAGVLLNTVFQGPLVPVWLTFWILIVATAFMLLKLPRVRVYMEHAVGEPRDSVLTGTNLAVSVGRAIVSAGAFAWLAVALVRAFF